MSIQAETVFTGGEDGYVRIWKAGGDAERENDEEMEE